MELVLQQKQQLNLLMTTELRQAIELYNTPLMNLNNILGSRS